MVTELTAKKFSKRRATLIILVGLALPVLIAYQLGLPIRSWASDRFVQRGNAYLAARQYDQAQSEYRRAIRVYEPNTVAKTNLDVAMQAVTDPRAARQFFAEHGNTALVRMIDEATAQFPTPKSALTKAVELAGVGEYALARYPVEEAIRMDSRYPEAWNQASIIYDKLAEVEASYRTKASTARSARDALSPAWLTTAQ